MVQSVSPELYAQSSGLCSSHFHGSLTNLEPEKMQIDPKVVQEEPARDRGSPRPRAFQVTFNVRRCSFQNSTSSVELQSSSKTGSLELALSSEQLTTPDKHKISRWNDSINLYCKVTHQVVTLPRWLISQLILGPCVNSTQVSFIYIAGNLSHSTIYSLQHRNSVICGSSNCHQFIIYPHFGAGCKDLTKDLCLICMVWCWL